MSSFGVSESAPLRVATHRHRHAQSSLHASRQILGQLVKVVLKSSVGGDSSDLFFELRSREPLDLVKREDNGKLIFFDFLFEIIKFPQSLLMQPDPSAGER